VPKGLVVGIFPGNADPAALESALSAQQIDLTKVKVVARGGPAASEEAENSPLDFIDVAEAQEGNSLSDDMTKGLGIMGDAGGTGVPGLGAGNSLGQFSSGGGGIDNYLGGTGIPEDEVDNFNTAISEGRAVVLYADAGDGAVTVAAALKAAGLRNVRSY
jgi:hypothetical protein